MPRLCGTWQASTHTRATNEEDLAASDDDRRRPAGHLSSSQAWLSEDRELPYLYENTSTNRVAVFRENMYDSMGRRSHWCVWDGDNRSRLAAVRADKRARRVDFFAGIQTSLIAEAATVDGVENRGFVLEKVSTLETEIFGRRRRRPHCCRRARRLGSYCSCPFAGSRAPGACCHSGDQLPWAACRPCRPCRPSFSASRRAWLRVRGQNVNRCACLCDRGAAS